MSEFDDIPDIRRRALESLSSRLAKQLDDAIVDALRRHLKRPVSGPGELQRLAARVSAVTVEGEPGETYWLDDVALLWAGPPQAEEVDGKMRAWQDTRHLLPDF